MSLLGEYFTENPFVFWHGGLRNGLLENPNPEGGDHLKRTRQLRCPANMAHIRQSRPDSGLGFQVKVLKTLKVVPSLLGSGAILARNHAGGGKTSDLLPLKASYRCMGYQHTVHTP